MTTKLCADELTAAGAFLAGLTELCKATKVDVCGDDFGIVLYFEGEILGYIGMFEDCSYTFEPGAKSNG